LLIPIVGTVYLSADVPEEIRSLEAGGYLSLSKYRIALCSGRSSLSVANRLNGCNEHIRIGLRKSEEIITCANCGNEYFYDELLEKCENLTEVIRINEQAIEHKVVEKFTNEGFLCVPIEGYRGNYILQNSQIGKVYLLLFAGSNDNTNAIIYATEYQSGVIKIDILDTKQPPLPNTVIGFSGVDIILNDFKDFLYVIRDIPDSNEIIKRLQKVLDVEKGIIDLSTKLSWQFVENQFTDFFLDQIRSRVVQIYKYQALLKQFPQFSRIPVNAAGAGNADKITIDLGEYLDEMFKQDFTADAKRYTSSKVDHSTMEKVLHHLSKSPFDANRVIIIATTNSVTCWDDVASFKNVTGQYRLIIFTARLIAETAINLEFADELIQLMKDNLPKQD
jgi:hypothetical protein